MPYKDNNDQPSSDLARTMEDLALATVIEGLKDIGLGVIPNSPLYRALKFAADEAITEMRKDTKVEVTVDTARKLAAFLVSEMKKEFSSTLGQHGMTL